MGPLSWDNRFLPTGVSKAKVMEMNAKAIITDMVDFSLPLQFGEIKGT